MIGPDFWPKRHADPRVRPDHHPCLLWAFGDAPAQLRALSRHGGGETYVALLPPELAEAVPVFVHVVFMPCTTYEHHLADGSLVIIGAE